MCRAEYIGEVCPAHRIPRSIPSNIVLKAASCFGFGPVVEQRFIAPEGN